MITTETITLFFSQLLDALVSIPRLLLEILWRAVDGEEVEHGG